MRGTQSIDRAILLLEQVAARGRTGWVLADLAAVCALDKGTAHRILSTLVQRRLVERHPQNRRYRPGPLLFELALGRPDSFALQNAFEGPLARLAGRVKGLCYAFLRSDSDAVVAVYAGTVPFRGVHVELGTRRPLVLTAGGVSILLAMPRGEADALISDSLEIIRKTEPRRIPAIKRLLERSRRAGFGIAEGDIVRGTMALGVAIRDEAGSPFAAISVAGTPDYLPESRIPTIVERMREEAKNIELAAAQIGAGEGESEKA
jgi:DNA-binding IclR family transcriptional regulator